MSTPEQWTERAQYDLDTARAMLQAGRHLYVVFCCQQAVEKALKGVIALRTGETPPRLHNLPKLAREAGLQVDPERAELLRVLTNAYILSRYPESPGGPGGSMTAAAAAELLSQTEDTCEWILGLMQ